MCRVLEPILQIKNSPLVEASVEWKDRFDQKLSENSDVGMWLNDLFYG